LTSSPAAGKTVVSRILGLRAWKLALAGPSVYWYFPVFYALLSSTLAPDPLGLFALFVVLIISASWGFLVNDISDRESDARSGREDALHGHGIGRGKMYSIILLLAAVSWTTVFAIGGGLVFKAVLAVNYAVAVLYSAPPARLKVRRFWGFLANSLIERPLPILVLLTYMNYYTPATVLLPVLMELTWSVFKHQAADVKDDIRAGITTFAVSLGEARSNALVNSLLNPISVASLLALTALSASAIPSFASLLAAVFALILLGTVLAFWAERAGRVTTYLTPTDPPYIIYLNLSYRYLLLPAMAAAVVFSRPEYYYLAWLLAAALVFQLYLYSKLVSRSRRLEDRGPPLRGSGQRPAS
jgi:4-hydroxybenzoate polyprenyltransferase